VWLGIAGLVGGAFVSVLAITSGGLFGLVPLAAGIFGGASVVLIGGATYMLCAIDERLEKRFSQQPGAPTPAWD